MNVAAFNVAAMNIHHIIECSSPDSAMLDILFCLLRTWSFTLFTNSAASLPMTKVSEFDFFLVIQFLKFPRSIVNRLSVPCGMRISAEKRCFTMRCNWLQSYPKKFSQVSLIHRARQLHFSTLEKTKIEHNPISNNLVVTSFSGFHDLSSRSNRSFQDLDIHTKVLPRFDEVEDETTEGILAVKFSTGLDLAVTRSSPDPC